jgi:hypothetical protein
MDPHQGAKTMYPRLTVNTPQHVSSTLWPMHYTIEYGQALYWITKLFSIIYTGTQHKFPAINIWDIGQGWQCHYLLTHGFGEAHTPAAADLHGDTLQKKKFNNDTSIIAHCTTTYSIGV